MKLPSGKAKDAQSDDAPRIQSRERDAPAIVSHALSPSPADKKTSFWKLIDWKLMLALFFPVVLETLDYTIVATAQSRIASVFNALPLESYIATSYLLASTVFLPFFASIADIYGRHFGLQLSLLLFLVGSTLSTGAVNMSMVLLGRGIAGIGAAGLLTLVRTIMSDTLSLNKNNIQQSMLFLLYTAGYTTGPAIGGFLIATNFRWVFGINLPCTALGMVLCFAFLHKRSHSNEEVQNATQTTLPRRTALGMARGWASKLSSIDWVGTFLFVAGGILVLLALNWGPDDNWKSVRVIINLILGALLIVLCVLWEILLERRSPFLSPNNPGEFSNVRTRHTGIFRARPMLPIEVFTSYDMCVVQYGSFISGIVMFVMFYFVSIFATLVTGLPPAEAGIQLLYFAPGVGGGALLAILLIKHHRQPVYPIVIGNIIMTVGVGLIEVAMQHDNQGEVDGFMAMAGVGVGFAAGPLVIHARFTKPNHVAVTNAMLLFFRALGGTVGLAQCFTILNVKVNAYINSQLQTTSGTFSPSDVAALGSLLDNGLTSVTSLDDLPSTVQGVVRNAFRDGVRWGFVSLLPWLGVGCVLSVFLSRIRDSDAMGTGEKGETLVTDGIVPAPQEGRDIEAATKVS